MTTPILTLSIPVVNVGRLVRRLTKLNVQLERIDGPAISWEIGPLDTSEASLLRQTVTVEGALPTLPEYDLVGTLEYETGRVGTREDHAGVARTRRELRNGAPIEVAEDLLMVHGHDGHDGKDAKDLASNLRAETLPPLVWTAPDEELPTELRDGPPACDHCKKIRRRRLVYVLRHRETDELVRVGSDCVVDYLGGSAADRLSSYQTLLALANPNHDLVRLPGAKPQVATSAFLAACVAVGRAAKQAHRPVPSSADVARDAWRTLTADDASDRPVEVTEDDYEWARRLAEWAATRNGGDYFANLNVALRSEIVTTRRRALVASVLHAYRRANRTPRGGWGHVGTVGESVSVVVTVARVVACVTGAWLHVAHEHETGNCVVWFDEGRTELTRNARGTVTGTVQKHDYYSGRPQTTLRECSWTSEIV